MGFYFNSYLQYKTPPWLSPLHIHAHAQKIKKYKDFLKIFNFKYILQSNQH